MAGGGNYPVMDSLEWARAPWNESDPEYEDCEWCNGKGGRWLNEFDQEITEEEYESLSEDDKVWCAWVDCEECNGTGEIYVEREYYKEYEPDEDYE